MFGNNGVHSLSGRRRRSLFRPGCFLLLSLGLRAAANLSLPPAAAWIPDQQSPPAELEAERLRFPCPFPGEADRHVWDAPVSINARDADGFLVSYELENPAAFRGLNLFFRSGPGWLAGTLPVADGPQRVWLPLSAFEAQASPTGWRSLSALRLSPWRSGQGEGAVRLHAVTPLSSTLAVVFPGEESSPNPQERAFGRRNAAQWVDDLSRLSLPARVLEETELEGLRPPATRVLILPYNPRPSERMLRDLSAFVRRGGKLLVCYNATPELAALAGVGIDTWMSGSPGRWHRMRFEDPAWKGPEILTQTSTPHLVAVRPAHPQTRVLARWQDSRGNDRPEAAILLSPSAAWFSYLLGAEDDSARLGTLAFLLDHFEPGLAARAARQRVADLRQRLGADLTELAGQLPPETGAHARFMEDLQMLDAEDPSRVWQAVTRLSAGIDRLLAVRMPLAADIPLGIWEHSGRGLYPGDWPRTLRELAGAGITDLFVYISRTAPSPAHIVEAARPHGIRVHAWHICYNLDGARAQEIDAFGRMGRLQHSRTGERSAWLCPTHPDNLRAERERLLRLAATPGLGGLHLDYIRYPDAGHCYGDGCRQRFQEQTGITPGQWPQEVIDGPHRRAYLDWRAAQVSALVESVSSELRARHPGLIFSAAVWPDYPAVKDQLGQDWGHWVRSGWLDLLTPMSYTRNTGELEAWTRRHAGLTGTTTRLWQGLGVTSSHSRLTPIETLRQAHAALAAGAEGLMIFDLNPTVRDELFPILRVSRSGELHD